MATKRKIKLFNGRFYKDGKNGHIFIGAYSIKDAALILSEASGSSRGQIFEIQKYFSKGAWGNSMDGIKPERGAWVQYNYFDRPQRIV